MTDEEKKERRKEAYQRYKEKHADAIRENALKSYYLHRDERLQKAREKRDSNREQYREYHREYSRKKRLEERIRREAEKAQKQAEEAAAEEARARELERQAEEKRIREEQRAKERALERSRANEGLVMALYEGGRSILGISCQLRLSADVVEEIVADGNAKIARRMRAQKDF